MVSEGVRVCLSPLGDILSNQPEEYQTVNGETNNEDRKMKPFRAHGVAVARTRPPDTKMFGDRR
jgi:hypothetical protein